MSRAVEAVLAWFLCGAVHEAVHILAAVALGKTGGLVRWRNLVDALLRRRVAVPALASTESGEAALIRHAGWVGSVALLLVVRAAEQSRTVECVAALVALEAVSSDLL